MCLHYWNHHYANLSNLICFLRNGAYCVLPISKMIFMLDNNWIPSAVISFKKSYVFLSHHFSLLYDNMLNHFLIADHRNAIPLAKIWEFHICNPLTSTNFTLVRNSRGQMGPQILYPCQLNTFCGAIIIYLVVHIHLHIHLSTTNFPILHIVA